MFLAYFITDHYWHPNTYAFPALSLKNSGANSFFLFSIFYIIFKALPLPFSDLYFGLNNYKLM